MPNREQENTVDAGRASAISRRVSQQWTMEIMAGEKVRELPKREYTLTDVLVSGHTPLAPVVATFFGGCSFQAACSTSEELLLQGIRRSEPHTQCTHQMERQRKKRKEVTKVVLWKLSQKDTQVQFHF